MLQASIREEQLEHKVHSMRQQMSSRRTSMHEHVSQLALLREEVRMTIIQIGTIVTEVVMSTVVNISLIVLKDDIHIFSYAHKGE